MKRRAEAVFPIAYFVALLPLLPVLSLWLDEILELYGLRDLPVSELPRYIATNAGAVPLGYVPQWIAIHLLGYSPAAGRLPSAVFAALSCFGLGLLCRRLHIRYALLAMAVLALCPAQVRYATEARVYAQAICITIFCTLVFTYLLERPSVLRCFGYFALVAAGLYTQPYTVFVPVAHCIWLALERRRLLFVCAGLIAAAAASFAPWYLFATGLWRDNVVHQHIRFVFGLRELALVAHELVGAGYFGAVLIGVACLAGYRARERKLLFAWVAAPFIGPIVADGFFGYFFASRQLIFILPALAMFAAEGIAQLWERRRVAGCIMATALAVAWIAGDVRWFTKPREDWRAPSVALGRELERGGCVLFVPASAQVYFTFFEPRLASRTCGAELPQAVWLAVSPYDTQPEYGRVLERLGGAGFRPASPASREREPHIEQFRR